MGSIPGWADGFSGKSQTLMSYDYVACKGPLEYRFGLGIYSKMKLKHLNRVLISNNQNVEIGSEDRQ